MKTVESYAINQSEQKKILWLSFLNFDLSNIISQTEVSKQLINNGNEIHFFATTASDRAHIRSQVDPNLRLVPITLKFIPIITPILYVLFLMIFLPFYIIRNKPNYVITEGGTAIAGLLVKILFYPLKLKVVLDIRSTPIKQFYSFREYLISYLFLVSVSIAKKFDGITILTELMKKEFCHRFNIKASLVGVWTSGVSLEFFDPEKHDGEEMKENLGLSDKFIIFYHGAFRPAGLDETIKALEMLKDKHNDLVLFLLGSSFHTSSELKAKIQELGIQANVMTHESVNYADVPKYIALCDLGIIPLPNSPNWRYQCPLKLLEYLAMKKVVVATDIPANRKVVGDNKCGIYIESTEPEKIAAAIDYAYENRNNLKTWGTSGRKIIEEGYSWKKVAIDFDNFLSKI